MSALQSIVFAGVADNAAEAWIFIGGMIAMSARMSMGGKPSIWKTVAAVGLGFVWPVTVVAATVAVVLPKLRQEK